MSVRSYRASLRNTFFALATLTLVALTVLVSSSDRASADVTGTIAGHGVTIDGTYAGFTIPALNRVDLPAGGVAFDPLAASESGLEASSDDVSTSCAGIPEGTEVLASCQSTINDLTVSVDVTVIVTATQLVAQSTTSADQNGGLSDSSGSSFTDVCIQQVPLPEPCTAAAVAGDYPVAIPGVIVGTVTLQQETPRTTEGEVTGTGLTVSMLHFELTTPANSSFDLARADSFAGDVTEITPTPSPSPSFAPGQAPVDSRDCIHLQRARQHSHQPHQHERCQYGRRSGRHQHRLHRHRPNPGRRRRAPG